MWFMSNKYRVLFIVVLTSTCDITICDAITNTNFNSHIRDHSSADAIVCDPKYSHLSNNITESNEHTGNYLFQNTTNVKTLHKEELGKYATFAPTGNPVKFKEIPDSTLSSSSNDRGLLYHDQPGYILNDYEEGPHYTHGHDYHSYDAHPELQIPHGYGLDHHNHHDHQEHHEHHDYHAPQNHDIHHYSGHHLLDHGHYIKHYKHALAAKSLLWPLAGIALLGAAALVTNPVLLQLGVISGKRRRRDTEEITEPDFLSDTFTKYAEKIKKLTKDGKNIKPKQNLRINSRPNEYENADLPNENIRKRILNTKIQKTDTKRNLGIKKIRPSVKRNVDQVTKYPGNYNSINDDDKFIPIALKLRTPNNYVNN